MVLRRLPNTTLAGGTSSAAAIGFPSWILIHFISKLGIKIMCVHSRVVREANVGNMAML